MTPHFVAFSAIVANITGNPAVSVPLFWNEAGGIASLGLVGGYSLQPKLRSLHRTIYGPGSTPKQAEQAKHSFKLWHATSQALNLVIISGLAVYLWRAATPDRSTPMAAP